MNWFSAKKNYSFFLDFTTLHIAHEWLIDFVVNSCVRSYRHARTVNRELGAEKENQSHIECVHNNILKRQALCEIHFSVRWRCTNRKHFPPLSSFCVVLIVKSVWNRNLFSNRRHGERMNTSLNFVFKFVLLVHFYFHKKREVTNE